MLFEINLIKDRVVPRNLNAKRLVIVGSFVGFMLVVTLIIAFLGLRVGYDISTARQDINERTTDLAEIEPAFDAVTQAERDRATLQRRADQLFALWDAPIHFGAFYRQVIFNLKNGEGVERDKVAVVNSTFAAGTNNNQVRVTAVTNDQAWSRLDPDLSDTLSGAARQLTAGPGKTSRTAFTRASIAPEFSDPLQRGQRYPAPPRGAFVNLSFRPTSPLLFPYVEPDAR